MIPKSYPHTRIKTGAFRDRKYLDHLRESKCELTGFENSEYSSMAVDPAHVGGLAGGAGKGKKCNDCEALPLRHDLHMDMDSGFYGFWMNWFQHVPGLLRDMVRAYATLKYLKWRTGSATDQELVETVIRERDAA